MYIYLANGGPRPTFIRPLPSPLLVRLAFCLSCLFVAGTRSLRMRHVSLRRELSRRLPGEDTRISLRPSTGLIRCVCVCVYMCACPGLYSSALYPGLATPLRRAVLCAVLVSHRCGLQWKSRIEHCPPRRRCCPGIHALFPTESVIWGVLAQIASIRFRLCCC